ncbi:MAG TPA: hypothetical protein VIM31_02695 [Candidatus Microsaccharimonas sp.]|jgi:hypothetical protein
MTTVNSRIDQKLDNIQHQLDAMRREEVAFRGYVNRQFTFIATEMVTKDDLRRMEANLVAEMASKEDLCSMEAKMTEKMATREDLAKLTAIVIKIAEKVGVST